MSRVLRVRVAPADHRPPPLLLDAAQGDAYQLWLEATIAATKMKLTLVEMDLPGSTQRRLLVAVAGGLITLFEVLAPQWHITDCADALLLVQRGPTAALESSSNSNGGAVVARDNGQAPDRSLNRSGHCVVTLTDGGHINIVAAANGQSLFHAAPSITPAPPPSAALGVRRGRAPCVAPSHKDAERVALAWNDSARCVVVGKSDGEVELMLLHSATGNGGRRVLTEGATGAAAITCVCSLIKEQAHLVLTGSAEGELRLWTLAPAQQKPCLWSNMAHSGSIIALCIGAATASGAAAPPASSAGTMVISASSGGIVKLWALAPTGRSLMPVGYFLVRGQVSGTREGSCQSCHA